MIAEELKEALVGKLAGMADAERNAAVLELYGMLDVFGRKRARELLGIDEKNDYLRRVMFESWYASLEKRFYALPQAMFLSHRDWHRDRNDIANDVPEIDEWTRSEPALEMDSVVEAVFDLDCVKNRSVREAVLSLEEREEELRVENYTDEEVFIKYMELRELSGMPVDLEEFIAESRD